MFKFIGKIEKKLDIRALSVTLLEIHPPREVISTITPPPKKSFYLLASLLTNKNPISPNLIFKGRLKLRK